MEDSGQKVRNIEHYYYLLGDKLSWDSAKVRDLCAAARITLPELAAIMRLTEKALDHRMRKGFNKQDSLLLHFIAVRYRYHPATI